MDIVYYGTARGHLNPKFARMVGMPRPYAFGASMNAWVLDYVSNWAGQMGYVTYCNYKARSPALVGDVTYLDGAVTRVSTESDAENRMKVSIDVTMIGSPSGAVLGKADAEVLLPAAAR
jgi:hypothetical protein